MTIRAELDSSEFRDLDNKAQLGQKLVIGAGCDISTKVGKNEICIRDHSDWVDSNRLNSAGFIVIRSNGKSKVGLEGDFEKITSPSDDLIYSNLKFGGKGRIVMEDGLVTHEIKVSHTIN